jgi:hypothetical protein
VGKVDDERLLGVVAHARTARGPAPAQSVAVAAPLRPFRTSPSSEEQKSKIKEQNAKT